MKGWKTIIFNALLVLAGLLEMAGYSIPDTFTDEMNGAILAIVGAVGTVLRLVTTGPVGNKKEGI